VLEERKTAGDYTVPWIADGIPAGVYFYCMCAGTFFGIQKGIVLK
jgi:hypothetical protein